MRCKLWGVVVAAAAVALVWWQGADVKTLITSRANLSRPTDAKSAPVPVTITQVQKSDFPVYLLGLGTVQPYRTVTLRSRVDGQITKVSFKQGQLVKEGDPLIEIDKRPYEAALDQVKAKKQLDLERLRDGGGDRAWISARQRRADLNRGKVPELGFDHHPVRSRSQHRCCRKRRTVGHQRRRRAASQEFAQPPELPQGEPRRLAHPAIGGDVGNAPLN